MDLSEIGEFYAASFAALSVVRGLSRSTSREAAEITCARYGVDDWTNVRDEIPAGQRYEFMNADEIAAESGYPLSDLIGG